MVTWARDAIFFSFFLGLAAVVAWGLGAPSHPTTGAFGLALARLRTWLPILRFDGEGDPGSAWVVVGIDGDDGFGSVRKGLGNVCNFYLSRSLTG